MKQKDVKVGESYFFKHTQIEHRKHLVGKIVKVIGSTTRPILIDQSGTKSRKPTRFKLSTGEHCNSSELKPIQS